MNVLKNARMTHHRRDVPVRRVRDERHGLALAGETP